MMAPDVSVIVPVSARADDLARIVQDIRGEIEGTGKTYEIVLIVDGDLPDRLDAARAIAADSEDTRVLRFARRFGEGAALQAGLGACRASVLVTHPAYYQVETEVVGRLLKAVDGGADIAFASRRPRSESVLNRFQRWCFNALVRRLLGLRYRDVACGVRALRREVLKEISAHGAFHRFITVAAAMSGFLTVHDPGSWDEWVEKKWPGGGNR